jgi:hypothetical protein
MFDRRSPEEHLALNEFWNDLVRASGAQDVAGNALDPELAETVRYLHGLSATAPPASSGERVRRALQESTSSTSDHKEHDVVTNAQTLQHTIRPSGNGRFPAPPTLVLPRRILDVNLAYLAVAAVILLALGIGARIYWSGPPDSGNRANNPAIHAPGTPSPTDEILFEITLPADVVPADAKGTMTLAWESVPADSVTTKWSDDCCPGSYVYFVLDGSVTIEGDGPIQVIRHDGAGAMEDRESGVPTNLRSGDIVVIRNEVAQTWTTGAVEAEIVTLTLVSGDNPGPFSSHQWRSHRIAVDLNSVVLPGGPYTLSLSRVGVQTDSLLDLPENVVNQLAIVHEGNATIGRGIGRAIRVSDASAPVTLFVLTLSTTTEGSGTPVAGMGASVPSPTP